MLALQLFLVVVFMIVRSSNGSEILVEYLKGCEKLQSSLAHIDNGKFEYIMNSFETVLIREESTTEASTNTESPKFDILLNCMTLAQQALAADSPEEKAKLQKEVMNATIEFVTSLQNPIALQIFAEIAGTYTSEIIKASANEKDVGVFISLLTSFGTNYPAKMPNLMLQIVAKSPTIAYNAALSEIKTSLFKHLTVEQILNLITKLDGTALKALVAEFWTAFKGPIIDKFNPLGEALANLGAMTKGALSIIWG